MQIEYSKQFLKDLKKSPEYIQTSFKSRLGIFINDQNNLILNNHPLLGKLKGYRSINITSDWRAIFVLFDDRMVYFVLIGSHSQLYS